MAAQNFQVNSDFPFDMVIYLPPVVSFVNDGSSIPILVAHGLPFTPLVDGSWDLTPTFDTNYDYFSGTIPSPAPNFSPFAVSVNIAADETNIILTPFNITGSDVTCYCRVFGFEPSDSNADLLPTAAAGTNFILNSDNNYTKLYKSGLMNSPANSGSFPVSHDLGRKPQVRAWVTNFGQTQPIQGDLINFGVPTASVAVVVEDERIVFKTSSLADIDRIDYRIYVDESGE